MGKKKRAANKLAKMSDEERTRYLQHRADIEEEARRRKQQLIAIFLKNKLKREEAFTRLNMAKINQEWRAILRNIKCIELRNEAKNVQTYFVDAFQRKNQTINRLLNELDQQEETYATLLNSHMESIDKLIGLHAERLRYWTRQYEHEKGILLSQYETEMESYKDRKFRAHKELECVFYALDNENETQIARDEMEHLNRIDEVRSKMMLRLEECTQDREEKMNVLWSKFQVVLKGYSEATGEKYAEYVELRERDNAATTEIHRHYLEIARATRDISLLKSILESQTHEHQLHMRQLDDYQQTLMVKQKNLKGGMSNTEKVNKKRLKTLVICSTEVNTKLEKILMKGKNILQMTSICGKYETERELIQPFRNRYQIEGSDKCNTVAVSTDFKELNLHIVSKMENFWIRLTNVEIDCSCMEQERLDLKKENEILKDKLRQYLQEVSITNGRVGSLNERLRPQSMKIENPNPRIPICKKKQAHRPVTGVEANLSIAVRSQLLVQSRIIKTPAIYSVVN